MSQIYQDNMVELEWTKDTVIRLIEEYRERPQLWDTNHTMYRINTMKYEGWREIAAIFELDIPDVRKKLNSLLASHRREKCRVRTGQRTTWYLYKYFSFLPSHVDDSHLDLEETVLPDKKNTTALKNFNDTRNTADASSEGHDEGTHHEDDDYMEVVREEFIIKEESPLKVHRRPRPELLSSSLKKSRLMRRPIKKILPLKERETTESQSPHSKQPEGIVAEVLKLLRRSQHKKKDSCDSFGEYIADSLRKHDEKTQAMIKQAINNIIFEQEMQKYKASNQYTVVVSGVEENPLISDTDNSDNDDK